VPLSEAFEQVAAQAAELNAKVARTIIEAMRHILETMVLASLFACVHLSSNEANLRALFWRTAPLIALRAEVAASATTSQQWKPRSVAPREGATSITVE
jgi:hypothetical protein